MCSIFLLMYTIALIVKYFRSVTNNLGENNAGMRSICVCPIFQKNLFLFMECDAGCIS